MSVSFKARVVQAILIRESAVNFSKRKESKKQDWQGQQDEGNAGKKNLDKWGMA